MCLSNQSQWTNRRIVLFIACMASFITPFLASSVNVAHPTINADFSVPDQALLGWVVTSFLLSAAVFVVLFGRIADIFGRKKIFVMGLSIIVLSSLLCSASNSIFMLIASRAVEGIGMGINVAIVYLGLSTGPLLGGIITQYVGWRSIYAGVMVYALATALLAWMKINGEWRCAETGKFDILGTLLYGAMLFTLIYGLSLVPDIVGAYMLVLAGMIMVAFFKWEL